MAFSLTTWDRIKIFSKFIGQKVWIRSLHGYLYGKEREHQFGILTGVKTDAIQVKIDNHRLWIHQDDGFSLYEVKLLLKPLSQLTPEIMKTANELPVVVFITQYYTNLGFDMPVFLEPHSPSNCKYVRELEMADYRSEKEILEAETTAVIS
ncbi:hypothetical protein GS399_05455 [Pedobacter sp. HMF7647]|uniref:Uncharacterized protein n=1 Tax=Hufsiella arboris TaxID=2695275 RepID=A0A7K1Y758_9SPHI|nr:hypothetical protein [Hufsiella arboris]MXV50412.1 hypothetical protein [Hufsiella arboris]